MTLRDVFANLQREGVLDEMSLGDISETACGESSIRVFDGDSYKERKFRAAKSCDALLLINDNTLVFVEMKRLAGRFSDIVRGYRQGYTEEQLRADPNVLEDLYCKAMGRFLQLLRADALPFKYVDSKTAILVDMCRHHEADDLVKRFVQRQLGESFVLLHDAGPGSTLSAYLSGVKEQLDKLFISKYNGRIKTVIPVHVLSCSEFDSKYGNNVETVSA
ncbi:hypothetical protein GKC30_08695 [Pseudodesulfovibrio sp. F-1]|uniref:NERD domain-containing protein n=1 Tax=Pseudodesulfovibrio alkaliphilus TaxID=2661613 RepID=A0A7K1KNX7_9BACT|nr:hypothetical protein [Pseudodesulfovibrio alkaliphilus]MUM77710.1 hypothetical protein [Pseudodesulfovibrio alkaliphilus]